MYFQLRFCDFANAGTGAAFSTVKSGPLVGCENLIMTGI